MQIFFIIFICLVSVFSYCQAPGIEWEKSIGGSGFDGNKTYTDGAVSVYQTSDNANVIAGGTYSTDGYATGNHGDEDILVVKLNAKGNLKWKKCLGGTGAENLKSIRQTFDGGYIIVGSTTGSNDGDVSGNHGQADAWVVKLDSQGNILWQKCFGGSKGDYGLGVQQTKDSGFIVACRTQSSDGDVKGSLHGDFDYWILKINEEGVIKWQKLFGGSVYDSPDDIEETLDGGYIVAGDTNSNDGDVTGNHGGVTDAWVIKLDSSGNPEWTKCIGGSLRDEARSIKQTADSGYIVAILTRSSDGDVTGNHGEEDYLLVKLDKKGSIIWSKCLGGSGDDLIEDIQVVNGYYLITGASNSVDGNVSGNHGGLDYWTLKTDSTGNIIWQTSLGGENDDEAFTISYKPNDGYLTGGESNSLTGDVTGNHGDYDFWIVKLKDDTILPVKLFNFTAQKQNNSTLLQWQTTSEINNNYFSIERSSDSKLFTSIGSVKSLNGTNTKNYSFADNSTLKGKNYYRVKQVDNDGKYSYSGIASVDFTNNVSVFSVSPNPANNIVNLAIPESDAVSEIIIYDINGKKLMSEQINSGIIFKKIDISKLTSGVYSVVFIQSSKRQVIKLIKK